ncbi:MAG: hypothetical protein WC121_00160 [Candidatus Kapaibacterium sp.]
MLTYQSNIAYTSNNNLTVSPNSRIVNSPNKRGCCQTKRRNYGLLTSSNGISNSTEKTCCANNKKEEKSCSKKSCTSKKSNYKPNQINNSLQKNNYSETEINSFKNEYDNLVSNGTIRLNEYLEIFEEGSKNTYQNYKDDEVKAKLLNPNLKLDVVSRIDEKTNSININIIDVDKNRKYLDQTFVFNANESELKKYEESLAVHTFVRWITLQNIYKEKKSNKKSNKIQEHKPQRISKNDCKERFGIDSECMCINHDMGCSAEPVITRGGKLKFWYPCAGSFDVDVYDCCFNHDVALWCSSGIETAALLGVRLITCFEEKIIEKYLEESSALCSFFWLPLLVSKLVFLPTLLSPFFGIIVDLFTGAEFRNSDGAHSDSCLCGGDLPTACCGGYDGVCRDECCNKIDLCSHKVDKTRGEGCKSKPPCEKKCTYYVSPNSYNPNRGTLTSYTIFTDKEEYYSKGNPDNILKKSDCCTVSLPEKCTDKCFNCFYACKLNPNGKGMSWNNGKILIDSSHLGAGMRGVPCCDGTPYEDLNSRYNYCSKDYGKGGGGIPDCGSPVHKKTGGPCNEVDRVNKSNTNKLLLGNMGKI